MGPTNFFRFRSFFELQYFELHNFYCIHNTTEVANMLHCCPIYDQISRDFDAFASTSIDANRSLTCDGLFCYMVHFVLLWIFTTALHLGCVPPSEDLPNKSCSLIPYPALLQYHHMPSTYMM